MNLNLPKQTSSRLFFKISKGPLVLKTLTLPLKINRLGIFLLVFNAAPILLIASAPEPHFADPSLQKRRLSLERTSHIADVVVEWVETLEECDPTTVCVQGQLFNRGGKPAHNVKLRVEIGATTLSKPRLTLIKKISQTTMEPNERQEFSFTLDRQIPQTIKGKTKIIEVGKYNFRIVPLFLEKKK